MAADVVGGRLRLAVVLAVREEAVVVQAGGRTADVAFAGFFPRPRAERVRPGNLVALAAAGGADVVVWRWFDAVVLAHEAGQLRVWEPGHGEVLATPRSRRDIPPPGGRAYVSAGLPGAEWWLAGPVVTAADDADVDVDEVTGFLVGNGLLDAG